MYRVRHLGMWIWKQLKNLELLAWLGELFGWQKVTISSVLAIALATKASWENLPTSLIILIGSGAFAVVLIVLDAALRIYTRQSRSKLLEIERGESGTSTRDDSSLRAGSDEPEVVILMSVFQGVSAFACSLMVSARE